MDLPPAQVSRHQTIARQEYGAPRTALAHVGRDGAAGDAEHGDREHAPAHVDKEHATAQHNLAETAQRDHNRPST